MSVREELLNACQTRCDEARRRDWGCGLPDTGKLVREGLRAGMRVIETTDAGGDLRTYLARLVRGVEAVKERYRADPTSDDGWNDEDGWILGGLSTILGIIRDAAARHGVLPP